MKMFKEMLKESIFYPNVGREGKYGGKKEPLEQNMWDFNSLNYNQYIFICHVY